MGGLSTPEDDLPEILISRKEKRFKAPCHVENLAIRTSWCDFCNVRHLPPSHAKRRHNACVDALVCQNPHAASSETGWTMSVPRI